MEPYSHLSNKREVTLTDFEKKYPPSTFIDFLDLFHPPLLVYCIYVLVFFQKIPPSTFILTSTAIRDMRVHAGKKLVFRGYLISEIFNQNNLTCILLLG